MGFRSTMITDHAMYKFHFPQWFRDAHPWLNADELPLSSQCEVKFYRKVEEQDVFVDIQRVMRESSTFLPNRIVVVLVHECGGITRIEITKESIVAHEPTGWKQVDQVEHGDQCSWDDIH